MLDAEAAQDPELLLQQDDEFEEFVKEGTTESPLLCREPLLATCPKDIFVHARRCVGWWQSARTTCSVYAWKEQGKAPCVLPTSTVVFHVTIITECGHVARPAIKCVCVCVCSNALARHALGITVATSVSRYQPRPYVCACS